MCKKPLLSRLNLGHLQFLDGWLECWHTEQSTFDSLLLQNVESLHVECTEIIGGVLVCEGQERGSGCWI